METAAVKELVIRELKRMAETEHSFFEVTQKDVDSYPAMAAMEGVMHSYAEMALKEAIIKINELLS